MADSKLDPNKSYGWTGKILRVNLTDGTVSVSPTDPYKGYIGGMGLANTLAAIECGITTVQSTLGGLGGCPFAPGASGNTATEDLVYMLQRMGYDTGIDFEKLLAAAKYQKSFIDGIYSGHQQNINTKTPPCC